MRPTTSGRSSTHADAEDMRVGPRGLSLGRGCQQTAPQGGGREDQRGPGRRILVVNHCQDGTPHRVPGTAAWSPLGPTSPPPSGGGRRGGLRGQRTGPVGGAWSSLVALTRDGPRLPLHLTGCLYLPLRRLERVLGAVFFGRRAAGSRGCCECSPNPARRSTAPVRPGRGPGTTSSWYGWQAVPGWVLGARLLASRPDQPATPCWYVPVQRSGNNPVTRWLGACSHCEQSPSTPRSLVTVTSGIPGREPPCPTSSPPPSPPTS